ncbi:type IV pilin protein [Variovorax dokdonensis]|uniref:Type IV pilin protein n=1 Tax=Variovorax dokdonensis TaxID=344883 RepID=A0ABT7N9P2_9BURK|nr:type IV pilin protein [Variovorax dokdonensis]MDM0044634.1 type IV pilin protein [Variovorax dokdonensis]
MFVKPFGHMCTKKPTPNLTRSGVNGFTLIELMIVVAVIAILAAIAVPSYNDYIRRGQVAEAFGELASYRSKMEQYYQDNRNYGSAAACANDPTANSWNGFAATDHFTFGCQTGTATGDTTQQSFTITATGSSGQAVGHVYTINELGKRTTTKFKGSTVSAQCWLVKSASC